MQTYTFFFKKVGYNAFFYQKEWIKCVFCHNFSNFALCYCADVFFYLQNDNKKDVVKLL